jgi:voltage-gated potassium channel
MPDESDQAPQEKKAQLHSARWELLDHIVCLTRVPVTILSFVWVALIILNFVARPSPVLTWLSNAIWIIFILDFLFEVAVAPHKMTYIRRHWLTLLSLALPAFSMLRILRALQLVRLAAQSGSLSLLRIVTAVNRGMAATRRALGHRQLGYILVLTLVVMLAGAAGMFGFENPSTLRAHGYGSVVQQGGGLSSYPEAVWWTAMLMTTIGSSYFPVTPAGQVLSFLLALYALSVFGYITATIASYFVGRKTDDDKQDQSQDRAASTAALQSELAAVREQLNTLLAHLDVPQSAPGLVRETRPISRSVPPQTKDEIPAK